MAAVLPREMRVLLFRHRRVLRALAVAAAVVLALAILKPGARRGQQVLVAAHDLALGTRLTAADLAERTIPADLLPEGSLRPGAAVLGRTLTAAARRGEILTDARLLDDALTIGHPGSVADPVRISDAASVTLLRPGALVDLFAASATGDGSRVERIAHAALVITIPAADPDATSSDGALVVLAVPADLVATIARAAQHSTLSVTVVG